MKNITSAAVRIFLLLLISLVISSCTSQRITTSTSQDSFTQLQARLVDIPIPFNVQQIKGNRGSPYSGQDNSSMCLRVKTSLPYDELKQFYKQEMDQGGWRLISSVEDEETCYFYQKPTRWCSIVIRPSGKMCFVSIFSGRLE